MAKMTTRAKAAAKAAEASSTEPDAPAEPAAESAPVPAVCVVKDGTPHMGSPVHGGKVCSAHEMHYRADGTRRVPLPSSALTAVKGPKAARLK